jgi:hypothetical protein
LFFHDLLSYVFLNQRFVCGKGFPPDGAGAEQVSSPVDSEMGSPAGFVLFYFFNPLTEARKPTAFVIHGLT